jgi:hypothetical protein
VEISVFPAALVCRGIGRLVCLIDKLAVGRGPVSFGASLSRPVFYGPAKLRDRASWFRGWRPLLKINVNERGSPRLATHPYLGAASSQDNGGADHPATIFLVVGQSRDDVPTVVPGGKPSSRLVPRAKFPA